VKNSLLLLPSTPAVTDSRTDNLQRVLFSLTPSHSHPGVTATLMIFGTGSSGTRVTL